jgi:hypothetical protein
MNINAKLLKLKYALQALAQSADVQLDLFPDFVRVADELALDFENWYSVFSQNNFDLTSAQKDYLEDLDALLREMSSDRSKEELWTDSALTNRHEWKIVRDLAKRILDEFNWELDKPPFDRNNYVRSSNRN